MFELRGKKAIVTGATGGIGGAIIAAFVKKGAQVVATGTNLDKLQSLKNDFGDGVSPVQVDLTVTGELDNLMEQSASLLGSIDILVNNAGIVQDNLALRMKNEDWHKVLNLNLTVAFQLSRACLRGMMKGRWGRIINITSVVGVTGNAGQVNYAASKAGMIGMSKSLAQEVASRGITVNCIAPGFIATNMTDDLGVTQKESILTSIPVGRMGQPEEVSSSAVFLASEEASYITGQTLHVNGGLAMI